MVSANENREDMQLVGFQLSRLRLEVYLGRQA